MSLLRVVPINEWGLRKEGLCWLLSPLSLLYGSPEFHHQVMGGCDQKSVGSGDLHGYRGCLVRCQSADGPGWWPIRLQLHCGLWFAVG